MHTCQGALPMECIIINLLVMAIGTFAVVQFKDLKETAAAFTVNPHNSELEECKICAGAKKTSN